MLSPSSGRLCGVCLVAIALLAPAPARAAEFDKLDVPSLKEIPADAAFYSAMLRNKEQVNLVLNSKAWKKFAALPGVQDLWQKITRQLEQPGPGENFQKFLEDPENKQLIELLADMVSNEVYFYGGPSTTPFAELTADLYASFSYGPLLIQATGNPQGLRQDEMQKAAVLRALVRNANLIQTPDLLVGFKISKTQAAEDQLKRLEALLGLAEKFQPDLKGRVKRVKVAGGDFVTLNLDGEMLPLDDFSDSMKKYEEKQGDTDTVIKKLKTLKLTIGIGIRKGYVLLYIGPSLNHLEKFGQGQGLLARTELKPLAAYADRRLTSIGYASKELRSKFGTTKKDLRTYQELANAWLPKAPLTDEQKARLKKDLAGLVKEVEPYIPETGAALGFTFLTDRGKEGYAYDWTPSLTADSTKALTLLNHVGGDPLIAVVGRSKESQEEYTKFVRWVKLAYGWGEEIALPNVTPEQKQQYEKVFKALKPLLVRLDATTGKMLVPSLQEGQGAFVIDGKLTSKRWSDKMPESEKALPLLEPAIVLGVSDTELLTKAFTDYRGIANDLIKEMRNLEAKIPEDFTIPAPKSKMVKGGTLYYYPLPQEAGLDAKLLPNATVGTKLAVLSLSEDHSVRLLTPTPLKVQGGPLADLTKKRSGASYVNLAGLVDTLVPWVEYGMDNSPFAGAFDKDDVLLHVKAIASVLKCFRLSTSSTYEENGATVTHSETIIHDLQ